MSDAIRKKVTDKYQKLMDEIKQERDELNVKAHLIRSEVRDEWEDMEEKWEHFCSHSKRAGREVKDASGEVWVATKLLGEEIKEGYKRIRKSI
jgi:hypothetical protein